MKKLAFFIQDITTIGGTQRVGSYLLNELKNLQVLDNYYCISLNKKNDSNFFYLDDRITIKYLNKKNSRMRYHFIIDIFKIIKYLKKEKIDILVNMGIGLGMIGGISKIFIKDLKIIFCEHSSLNNQLTNNIFQRISRFIAVIFSDKIITLTKEDKKNYMNKYRIKEGKIGYIYNFIDDSLLNMKTEYNIKSKKIITVGRFDKVKGYDRLVKIAKIIFEKDINWEWHIYGKGEEFLYIKKLVKENNLEKKVILKGEAQDIYRIYRDYSFYVHTSYFEGFGLTLIEAKANCLPIVSFNCPNGPAEIIRNNIDGFLVENGNIDSMVEKIEYLINNPDVRKKFSEKSKENLNKFSKSIILEKWKDLIENI